MNRSQAQKLIGTRVSAWTAMNGSYIGELLEVLLAPRMPWRGRIRIEGVIEPASCADRIDGFRRGFRIGEGIEFGGVNIAPASVENSRHMGRTYRTAVKETLMELEREEWDSRHERVRQRLIKNRRLELSRANPEGWTTFMAAPVKDNGLVKLTKWFIGRPHLVDGRYHYCNGVLDCTEAEGPFDSREAAVEALEGKAGGK